jgi:hypothetical protein
MEKQTQDRWIFLYLLGDGQQGDQQQLQLTREQVEQEQELIEKQTQDRCGFLYLPAAAAHQVAGRAGAGTHGETDAGQVHFSLLTYFVMNSQ